MKVIFLMIFLAAVAVNAVAGEKKVMGGTPSVVLAVFDGGHKIITLNKDFDLVCVETAYSEDADYGASFTCWSTDSAPKKIRNLVKRYQDS